MNTLLKDERELLSKPGDTILETIEHLKMSQVELAERMGRTAPKVNDLISGKEPITVSTALQLEKVLGIDAQFWLNSETRYRETLARLEYHEALERNIDWLDSLPITELIKKGYLKSKKRGAEMVEELLRFFGIASPSQMDSLYIENYTSLNYRKSPVHQPKLGAMAAFLRIGEIEMRKLSLKNYDKEVFKKVLQDARVLVKNHPEDFALQLHVMCLDAGVALVYSSCITGAPVSGVTRWVAGHPLIQLTDRHKDYYHFWVTFYHEAGHVWLHGKKDVFMEEFEGFKKDEQKEIEADEFAIKWLLLEDIKVAFNSNINESDVRRAAQQYQTNSAIVLGHLIKLKLVKPNFGSSLKRKVILDYVINKSGVS